MNKIVHGAMYKPITFIHSKKYIINSQITKQKIER